jgi:hypothetical protein
MELTPVGFVFYEGQMTMARRDEAGANK